MAEETKAEETMQEEPEQKAAQPKPEQTDYKALYEQAKAEARKWEDRSKANWKAAHEAEETAKKSVEDQLAELQGRLEQMQSEKEHAELVARVAEAKGIPASLLHGDTEEELESLADAISAYAQSRTTAPADRGGAPAGGAELTREQIMKLDSPYERVAAYARQHQGR